jgi:parvulin-like peptidyl-prolyl isomerase
MKKVFLLFVLLLMPQKVWADHVVLIDKVVATVGGEAITTFDVKKRMKETQDQVMALLYGEDVQKGFRQALDSLIAEKLLLFEAKKIEIDVSDEEVKESLEEVKKESNWSDEDFERVIQALGFTKKQYFEMRKTQMLVQKVLQLKVYSKIRVGDREVEEAFQKEFFGGEKEEEIHLWHIVFRVGEEVTIEELQRLLEKAKEVRESIVRGEMTFEEAAKRFSEDGSAQRGGEIGFFVRSKNDLHSSITNVVFKMKEGEVSQVVQSPVGFHIFRVTERRLVPIADKEEAKAMVRYRLTEEVFQREVVAYIEDLKGKYGVEYKDDESARGF